MMENQELVTNAIRYIQSSSDTTLTLAEIAEHAGFSLGYFDTLFTRHTGMPVVEYARVYKLTRAALSLRASDRSVLDLSLDFGYANPKPRSLSRMYGLCADVGSRTSATCTRCQVVRTPPGHFGSISSQMPTRMG